MELVGRSVTKTFDGFGTFSGVVESYDPSAGFFRIQYEDGDSEDAEFHEIASILDSVDPASDPQTLAKEPGGIFKETTTAEDSQLIQSCYNGDSESESASEDEQKLSDSKEEIPESMPSLPPSSTSLDIEEQGIPILDLFSVYACLRSFSRLLFLSPFRLETFIAALRSRFANPLIDSIHFSILQALKPHLEFLSVEGSREATDCLRNLNWGLLDSVTWPVYVVQYLMIRKDIKLNYLELLTAEYYKQPAVVKLEVLRCLCDDVVEVEAIRSELNKRMTESEYDNDRKCKTSALKVSKDSSSRDRGGSVLAEDVVEETADGNIDECCLCSMDGSLICCDGCPAAFHSKCVGVSKDHLPEGDWYCPECVMEKGDGFVKSSKLFRGAELLGADPHGRLYFGSCGYLLVSSSCDTDASYHYYSKNDLNGVIKALTSSCASYCRIINAISRYRNVPFYASNPNVLLDHGIYNANEDAHMFSKSLLSSKLGNPTNIVGRTEKEYSSTAENHNDSFINVLEITNLNHVTSNQLDCGLYPVASSEISGEKMEVEAFVPKPQLTGPDLSMSSPPMEELTSSKPSDLDLRQEKYIEFPSWRRIPLPTEQRKQVDLQQQYDPFGYTNYYNFGRIASAIARELMNALPDSNNKDANKIIVDLKSVQLKAISKKSIDFYLYNHQKQLMVIEKENCGWCFSCRISIGSDCLFTICDDKLREGSKNRVVGFRSVKKKKSHLVSARQHILSIEDRIRSLLCGPWENPYYSKQWCRAVLKASDVASLKHLLLVLELNLRRVALSAEWLKPEDSAPSVGSSSLVFSSPLHASSSHSSRRQAKKSVYGAETNSDYSAGKTSDIHWWRGGRLSRQVFLCKMLPQSLAYKGGRQAGCKKIPSILYHDNSDFPQRSKFVAWRASVEMSKNVAQLVCQVKDFESNIRWTELSDSQFYPQLAKESKKLTGLLKKVTIRRKCIEGMYVKYLLDLGKREKIPFLIAKHGVMLQESSSGRKMYWLTEKYVPLNLIKAFEAKKSARILKRTNTQLLLEKVNNCCKNVPKRSKGLIHLLSREPQSQLCGHCNEDVLIRQAVNCQFCNGFFHRKHFRVPKGAITTAYTCLRCKDERSKKVKSEGHKVASSKKNLSVGKQPEKLRNEGKHLFVKSKKNSCGEKRKRSPGKIKNEKSKKSEDIISYHKRKRTEVHHSYWLNGLLWTRKPVDERGKHFRERKVLLSPLTECTAIQPVCSLCCDKYNSGIYIGCESCEDWFHGEAFHLNHENIDNLIGFKCHKCRMESSPLCPFSKNSAITEDQLLSKSKTGVNDEKKFQHGTYEDGPTVHNEEKRDNNPRAKRSFRTVMRNKEKMMLNTQEEFITVKTFDSRNMYNNHLSMLKQKTNNSTVG